MKRKRTYKCLGAVFCVLGCLLVLAGKAAAKEEGQETSSVTITDGEMEYGSLYGAPYSGTDDTQWLTLELGGRGLRIINEEGSDIVLIDQFGEVYLNGQRCNPEQEEKETGIRKDFSYGFMYFLVIVSLALGGYNVLTGKERAVW